jgi:hypothetical protein
MYKKQCFTDVDIGESLMLTGKDYNEALKQYKCHFKASLRYSLPTIKASS